MKRKGASAKAEGADATPDMTQSPTPPATTSSPETPKKESPEKDTETPKSPIRAKIDLEHDEVSLHVDYDDLLSVLVSTKVRLVVLFTALSLITRFYLIEEPPSVAWDETHFGKFANYYINHTFYFDVHPPLAKMLIAFAGQICGYDATYEFKEPGQAYPGTDYVWMRMFCATMGAMCVPIGFLSVYELTQSFTSSSIAATIILCETAFVTASRFILLDPILMVFIHAAFYASVAFYNTRERAFSASWWFWLCMSGVFISCAMSSKWVGLFIILFVGAKTAIELWDIYGDVRNSLFRVLQHVMARVLGLIVLPIIIYLFFFAIHLAVLYKSGSGDSFMSSAYQSTLEGNPLHSTPSPEHIAFGSVVTIKNTRYGGGLLHSHPSLYPEGMVQQQQVTGYLHRDSNNEWRIKRAKIADEEDNTNKTTDDITFVRSGDRVRLEHVMTKRNLHSHAHPAPVTKKHQQVTCYGNDGRGDIHDEWTIVLVDGNPGDKISRISSRFRLLHGYEGHPFTCALHSDGTQLPKWGFDQLEVTCTPRMDDPNAVWNVEMHTNPLLPSESVKSKAPSILSTILELHFAMFMVNNQLVPKENENPSLPWEWPITNRGQRFTAWGDNDRRVYLLGNAVIFWGNLVLLALFLVLAAAYLLICQRKIERFPWDTATHDFSRVFIGGLWLILAWALHYLPFFLMKRVLYFHHYLPAHLFTCMLSALVLDYLAGSLANLTGVRQLRMSVSVLFMSVYVWSFFHFNCMSYGMTVPLKDMAYLKWGPNWEIA